MESTIIKKNSFQFTDTARELLIFGICLICIFLFLFSAYEKVTDHKTFTNGLSKVAVIGTYAGLIAWLVPIAEIVIALLLIIPKTTKWGLYGFTGLMVVFTLYVLSMMLWAEKLPCHCNLIIDKLSWGQHVWFNLGFIALAIFAITLSKSIKLKY